MPVVNIKGVGDAQFPDDMSQDDIRSFLQKKYIGSLTGDYKMPLESQPNYASPRNLSLAEKGGQAISDFLIDNKIISNNYGAQQIGSNLSSLGEFLPILGDASAGDEFGRAATSGDVAGMAMAGLGAIPLIGDAAKGVVKAIKPEVMSMDKALKNKYPDVKISISENADNIILNKVIVPEKSKGTGTKFMNDLIKDADSKGKPIGLTPSSDFGGNKNRLTEFYKRFGFVENKGKNKDFTISESMIREPKK
jgi:uncharacterized protein YjfI (DUF2170 family)